MKSVLLFSFLLFSLSIIDATPSRWLLFLDSTQTDDNIRQEYRVVRYRDVQYAYYAILWLLALVVLVVNPTILGIQLCSQLSTSSRLSLSSADVDDKDKKRSRQFTSFTSNKPHPLAFRFFILIGRLLIKTVRTFLSFLCGSIWKVVLKIVPQKKKRHILVMTHQDGTKGRTNAAKVFFLLVSGRLKAVILGCIVGPTCTVVLLRFIAGTVVGPSLNDQTVLAQAVSLMTALGIIISSVLNGFGSVSMPYSCLAGLFLEPIHPEAVAYSEKELERTKGSLEERKTSLEAVKLDVKSGDLYARRKSQGNFGDIGDEVNQRRKMLSEDISFLETLVIEMEQDLVEMRHSQYTAAMSRTLQGRLLSWLGLLFSLILIIRLISALIQTFPRAGYDSLSMDDSSRVDIITRLVLFSRASSHDAELLSQCISLVLTAFLSFSQVRYFLRTAVSVRASLSGLYKKVCCVRDDERQPIVRQDVFDLVFGPVVSGLMGCYFLAANVLTKLMIPKEYRIGFSAALGGTHDAIHIRMSTLNTIFVASALISSAILGMRLGIQRQNTHRHQAWSSEKGQELDP